MLVAQAILADRRQSNNSGTRFLERTEDLSLPSSLFVMLVKHWTMHDCVIRRLTIVMCYVILNNCQNYNMLCNICIVNIHCPTLSTCIRM